MADELTMWSCYETIGIAMSNVSYVAKIEITDEMWAEIEKKAAAEGMDPVEWFDREIEKLNQEDPQDPVEGGADG